MRAFVLVAAWFLLCRSAAADVNRVEVNKQNQQARMGDAVRISISDKGEILEVRVFVKIPPRGKFLGAGLELSEQAKVVAHLPLDSKPDETFNRGPQAATGRTITFRVTRELAQRSFLNVGLDHQPNAGTGYHIDLGSYLK